jgi:hypothetical protein
LSLTCKMHYTKEYLGSTPGIPAVDSEDMALKSN